MLLVCAGARKAALDSGCVLKEERFAGGYAAGLDGGCERKGVKNNQILKNVLRRQLALTRQRRSQEE